jgi:hypothetical protein
MRSKDNASGIPFGFGGIDFSEGLEPLKSDSIEPSDPRDRGVEGTWSGRR